MAQHQAIEKPDFHPVFSILAILSVGLVLFGGLAGVITGSWQVRMYVAIASMIFDLVFVLEFLLRLFVFLPAPSTRPASHLVEMILLLVSSAVPFVIVSGPFILGWANADFTLAAVRGYWTSPNAVAALGTIASLRLLRPLRFFIAPLVDQQAGKLFIALIAALLCLVFGFAVAVDALLLPGYRGALIDTRRGISANLVLLPVAEANLAARSNVDIQALRIDGRLIFSDRDAKSLRPGDYEYYGDERSGTWFSLKPWQRARSLLEILSALLAISLPLLLAAGLRPRLSDGQSAALPPDSDDSPLHQPVGHAELDGILGK
ncbi:MAG: hypothetical protein A2087_05655 [Spirochaetes bacterium GWD1_61_31]|nr:MAG: hypothetical protein A2Y37_03535 [Spirochaetes bacterium GWB1_60_80]OHD35121.1 MAG: hypothetical protein A2004_05400 [Spirochaetes bacterium GWC1_61_12]OHD43640.1 MAG: hypothetical protein A2087_05655 [Spirochaetes bacterium GWD1_61_31]OHD44132.1 MAG: hypothetical protein A2Y35_02080 [Spirochaetes bacterium GWE1_60_18]OHD61827.1 MAG: hypothetical protein A2Y32_13795 [Spirochaetes bacterium GWF1_60_12]